jgi:hypothetical protein
MTNQEDELNNDGDKDNIGIQRNRPQQPDSEKVMINKFVVHNFVSGI